MGVHDGKIKFPALSKQPLRQGGCGSYRRNIVHKIRAESLCSIFFRYDLINLNLYGNMVTMGMESGLQNSPHEGIKINDVDLLFGRSFLLGGENNGKI